MSKLPVVTVLSTGNEIQPPGQRLLPGHVRDSNKTTLMSLLSSSGVKPRDGGIARDEITILTNSLHEALKSSEIVVTTGGVSMGDRDLLRQVLVDNFGAKIHFARVNMKPGKPTTFATCTYLGRSRLVIGLPGNPVSASVTCLLYVLPAVRMLSGAEIVIGFFWISFLGKIGGNILNFNSNDIWIRILEMQLCTSIYL